MKHAPLIGGRDGDSIHFIGGEIISSGERDGKHYATSMTSGQTWEADSEDELADMVIRDLA